MIPGGSSRRELVDEGRRLERDARRRRRVQRQTEGVETMDYAAMMGRLVARYGERLAEADYPDLADAIEIRDQLDDAIRVGVRAQAERTSWAQVAVGLGVTRQGAWRRWSGRRA